MANLVTIFIDNQPYEVDSSDNLLANVLSQKLNLPYFCWHPSMGSVGACRQCAVTQYQDESDTRGRVIMSCMTPVVDGMRIGLTDNNSSEFREQLIGAMMTNHPHDCPVCAEGGECHLQDMTVMTGHSARQYQGSKRTFSNQYLGNLVGHEMNRCITCYRCVRFYKDYAGGKDFGVFGSKNQVYFGRQADGTLESEFSGNLVEVCPTGVFTNKVFSTHYTRKWDLQSSPSVCAHCSVGCNTSIGERYGSVRRVMNRYNSDINGYFLCDRGRFGIGFVNQLQRLKTTKGINISHAKPESNTTPKSIDIAKTLAHFRGKNFIGIGSARASVESNAYLKYIVGESYFSAAYNDEQLRMAQQHLAILSRYPSASVKDIEQSDFVLILGEDVTQSSPRIALAIRQALRTESIAKAAKIGIPAWQDDAVRTCGGNSLSPLYSINTLETKLDDVSKSVVRVSFVDIKHWIDAIIEQVNTSIAQKGVTENTIEQGSVLPEGAQGIISALVDDLLAANNPLIVSGWSHETPEILEGIQRLLNALSEKEKEKENKQQEVKCVVLPKEANSLGLMSLFDEHTLSFNEMHEAMLHSDCAGVIVLENTLTHLSKPQQSQFITRLKQANKALITLDHTEHALTQAAELVFPTAAVTEIDGSFVNYQGRQQAFVQSHAPVLPIMASWRWLSYFDGVINTAIANHMHSESSSSLLSPVKHQTKQIPKSLFELRTLLSEQFTQFNWKALITGHEQLARETRRVSGRTAKTANVSVHEPKSTQAADSDYRFSMEGRKGTDSAQMPFVWAPGWNSNQAIHQFQAHVGGELLHQAPINYVNFDCCMPFINKVLADIKLDSNAVKPAYELVLKTPWYRGEWQASLNPEFTLLHVKNTLIISQSAAATRQWQTGNVVKITTSEEKHFAVIEVAKKRRKKQGLHIHQEALLTLDAIKANSRNDFSENVEITLATADEVERFNDENAQRLQAAENDKKNILKQLQHNDQYIPIRICSGGLNDNG